MWKLNYDKSIVLEIMCSVIYEAFNFIVGYFISN